MPTDQILTVLNGDCRSELKKLAPESVHCCVTSPPYWGLRSYLRKNHPDKAREIGSEATPEAFVETMVQVFREVRRCLTDSGTLWLNLGDCYLGGRRGGNPPESKYQKQATNSGSLLELNEIPPGCKPKDLCMIPWRVALALQADGWWLRSVIVWHKRSCMPESVTDRPTNSWEPIFLLAKSQKYFYDAEAVKEQAQSDHASGNGLEGRQGTAEYQARFGGRGTTEEWLPGGLRNQRNVWSLSPEPYSEAHFATFPTEIPRRAILAGTSAKGCCPKCYAPWERVVEKGALVGEDRGGNYRNRKDEADDGGQKRMVGKNGAEYRPGSHYITTTLDWQPGCDCNAGEPIPCTVLDPFGGSGTTGQVAIELGRRAVLVELNPEYVDLINDRCTTTRGFPFAV